MDKIDERSIRNVLKAARLGWEVEIIEAQAVRFDLEKTREQMKFNSESMDRRIERNE